MKKFDLYVLSYLVIKFYVIKLQTQLSPPTTYTLTIYSFHPHNLPSLKHNSHHPPHTPLQYTVFTLTTYTTLTTYRTLPPSTHSALVQRSLALTSLSYRLVRHWSRMKGLCFGLYCYTLLILEGVCVCHGQISFTRVR